MRQNKSNFHIFRLSRPVFELVERFERNPRIENADEDIREQRFLVEHEKMFLIYHKKDNYITASSRNFEKVKKPLSTLVLKTKAFSAR